jgi:hypothetical protein
MKRTAGFYWMLLAVSLTSCEWFASPETKAQRLVEEELSAINFNEVDQFPLFDACEETAPREEQQRCFQQTLVMHLAMALQDFEFQSEARLADTLFVDFMVDRQGKVTVVSMDKNPDFSKENPEFERIVAKSLRSLPRLEPALKRGIPVSAQFRIPLILKTDE